VTSAVLCTPAFAVVEPGCELASGNGSAFAGATSAGWHPNKAETAQQNSKFIFDFNRISKPCYF
jgi:hypothetical protein